MKLVALIAAACAGVLVALAIPTTSDLNPLRLVFAYERQHVRTGTTPDQLAPKTSLAATQPMAPPQSLKLDLGSAFDGRAESQMQENERRIQALQTYTRNPPIVPPPR